MIFKGGGGSRPTVPPSGSTNGSIHSFQTKSRVEQNQDQTSNYDKMEDPEFRYLYDMLSSDTKCAQCKFRQLLPLFTNSEPSANVDPRMGELNICKKCDAAHISDMAHDNRLS